MPTRLHLILCLFILMTSAHGADMEHTLVSNYDLRGAVKQCVEETTFVGTEGTPAQTRSITRTFSPAGQLIEDRMTQSNSPDFVTHYSYDAVGRLIHRSSGDSGRGLAYHYDDRGKLISVTSEAKWPPSTTYEYNGDHLARMVEHWPEIPREPNTAFAAMPWEKGDVPFPPPSGGTVTTLYDEKERPTGAEVRDADDVLIRRIVRHYDEQGHIAGDELTSEDTNTITLPLPKELPDEFAKMNELQLKAMSRFMNQALIDSKSSYKYDANGRVIEKRVVGGMFAEQVTTLRYNDHGDITDEISDKVMDPNFGREFGMDDQGNMVPQGPPQVVSPQHSEGHYEFEYDAQGNWTKKTSAWRSDKNTEFKQLSVTRRTITYY